MNVLLKILVIFNFSIAVAEEYLFESGIIIYKQKMYNHSDKKLSLFLNNVKSIDQHIIPFNVTSIKIVHNTIPRLYKGSVKNLHKVRSLSFGACEIRRISPEAFQNLPKLKSVYLQDNAIEEIGHGIFNYLPIEELYLQRNRIRIIRPDAFDNMPTLRLVKVNSNKLRYWDANWFKNTPQLTLLYFRRNYIRELPPRAFANIKTSHEINNSEEVDTVIYLSKNEIQSLHPHTFQGIDALNELWLDRNNITRVDRNTFSGIMEVQKLFLQRNKITEIDRYAFKNVEIMSELNLSDNDLTCLPYEVIIKAREINIDNNEFHCDCLKNLIDHITEMRGLHKIKYTTQCE